MFVYYLQQKSKGVENIVSAALEIVLTYFDIVSLNIFTTEKSDQFNHSRLTIEARLMAYSTT